MSQDTCHRLDFITSRDDGNSSVTHINIYFFKITTRACNLDGRNIHCLQLFKVVRGRVEIRHVKSYSQLSVHKSAWHYENPRISSVEKKGEERKRIQLSLDQKRNPARCRRTSRSVANKSQQQKRIKKNIFIFIFNSLQSKKICFDKVFGMCSALHRSVAGFAEEMAENWAVWGQRAALLDASRSCDPSLISHFVYRHRRRRTLGWNSRDVCPSIEQNSANWCLRFVSLWAAFTWEPLGENLPCRPEPRKQLCLWSAPFTLTLFELCFPLAFCECWVKKKKKKQTKKWGEGRGLRKKACVLHTFFKVCCKSPIQTHRAATQKHFFFLSPALESFSVPALLSFFPALPFRRKVRRLGPICKQVWTTRAS